MGMANTSASKRKEKYKRRMLSRSREKLKRRQAARAGGEREEGQAGGQQVARVEEVADYRLLEFHEVPAFLQDNCFVLSGYRCFFSTKVCLYSLLRIHNETGNVYTHLIACLIFLAMTVGLYQSDEFTAIEIAVLSVYYGACIFCFTASTCFHLFNCHSQDACKSLLKCDYSGVIVLTAASYVPPIFFGLSCFPYLRATYLACITLLGIGTSLALFSEGMGDRKYRSVRVALFVSLGLFGILPAVHGTYLVGLEVAATPFRGLLEFYGLLCIGLLSYFLRFPERLSPGTFDYWFHSHQFWHLFVFLGTLKWVQTCVLLLRLSRNFDCAAMTGLV